MIAGTVSAASAPIGDARAEYEYGVISHLNETARRAGGVVGEPLRDFIARLRGA